MKKPKCQTPRCKNAPKPTLCWKCQKAKWRKENPVKAAYGNLKSNAQKRGKVFTLSFERFERFCVEYNYIQGKGRTKGSLTIDRERNEEGYTDDNIRVMLQEENASKGTKILNYNWFDKSATVTALTKNSNDGPF